MIIGEDKPNEDIGAETSTKYNYQYLVMSFYILKFLNKNCNYEEIYGDLYDDIVIKKSSKKFEFIQVKTKNHDQPAFKSKDGAIMKTFIKNCEANKTYENQIENFTIVLGYDICKDNTYENPLKLLEEIKKKQKIPLGFLNKNFRLQKFLNKQDDHEKIFIEVIKKTKIEQRPQNGLINLLLKEEISQFLPESLQHNNDIENILFQICQISQNKSQIHEEIYDFLDYIGLENNSNLQKEDYFKNRLIKRQNFIKDFQDIIVKQKRNLILKLRKPIDLVDEIKNFVFYKKMKKGKFEDEMIINFYENSLLFQHNIKELISLYDLSAVKLEYDEIKIQITSKIQDLYLQYRKEPEKQHIQYYLDIITLMKNYILERSHNKKISVTHEYLKGIICDLTDECKIWWSKKFDVGVV